MASNTIQSIKQHYTSIFHLLTNKIEQTKIQNVLIMFYWSEILKIWKYEMAEVHTTRRTNKENTTISLLSCTLGKYLHIFIMMVWFIVKLSYMWIKPTREHFRNRSVTNQTYSTWHVVLIDRCQIVISHCYFVFRTIYVSLGSIRAILVDPPLGISR